MLTLLNDIHAQFRRQMNADVSVALRKHGLLYKVAFGVPSMRLHAIAERYTPSVELAEALWAEDIRESKMLATRLYPIGEMTLQTAKRWIDSIRYAEIADQCCMNLLAHLPFVDELMQDLLPADDSVVAPDNMATYTAMKLAARCDTSLWAPSLQDLTLRQAEQIAGCTACSMQLRTAAYWAIENISSPNM